MSKIIGPKDTITITLDGMTGQIAMVCSREMAFPHLVLILTALLQQLSQQALQALSAPVLGLTNANKTQNNPSGG